MHLKGRDKKARVKKGNILKEKKETSKTEKVSTKAGIICQRKRGKIKSKKVTLEVR